MAIWSILSQFEISRVDMTWTYTELFGNNKNIQPAITIPHFDFKDFATRYISNIVFFEDSYFSKNHSLAEKILAIILSPKYRNWTLEIINLSKRWDWFLEKIQFHINTNSPIEFMMPAFPFKIQNPLKSSRGDADLAEVASFLKFYEICSFKKRSFWRFK